MSTSPTKREGALPTPPTSRLGPQAGRRGHAHRRSGAISSHDVSTILRPSTDSSVPRPGSAPTTPCDLSDRRQFLPALDRSASQPILPQSTPSSGISTTRRESTPINNPHRARVGFSDTVEFIPRPLSTISSETSSSLSTVRANHSVAGSISSIISATTSSPPSAKKTRIILETSFEHDANLARPKTADAVMDGSHGDQAFSSSVESQQRPSSAVASPITPASTGYNSFQPRRKGLACDDGHIDEVSPMSTPFHESAEPAYPVLPPSASYDAVKNEPKAKRQRKVKSWAGSILSKKVKRRTTIEKANKRRSPTPPLRNTAPLEEFPVNDVDFDDDTTCVINTPKDAVPQPVKIRTDFSNWKPREPISPIQSDSFSPMLDLDAALGPFNTPSLGSDLDQNFSSGFSVAKRRMHSSGATGGFTGPGMHYHRRAESAPEMAPINYSIFGLHRLGSNSTMADVFEEDEEDDASAKVWKENADVVKEARHDEDLLGLGVQVVDADVSKDSRLERRPKWIYDDSARNAHPQRMEIVKDGHSTTYSAPEALPEECTDVEIVDAEEEPRFSVVTKSSDGSTITPSLSNDLIATRPASAPMDFAFPRPGFYMGTPETMSSVVSSPDFASTSFDVPRLNTAHSSITDRGTMSSSRTGDFGQDLRISVDDVPSLSSSASTMISAHPPRFSSSAGTRSSGDRSSSLSAAVPAMTRPVSAGKRSSLASLSRLVGSSYGEKSKLSIEERAQSDDVDRPERKKGNRITRLMRFWKSKEKLDSS